MAPSNSSRRSCRSAQALLSWTTTTRTIDEWRKLEFNEILKLKLLTNWDSSVQLCFPYYLPASIYLIHVNSTSILYFPFSSCIDQCIPRPNHMQRVSLSTSGITARRSSASCSRSGKAEPAWVVVVATTTAIEKLWKSLAWPSDRTTWILVRNPYPPMRAIFMGKNDELWHEQK